MLTSGQLDHSLAQSHVRPARSWTPIRIGFQQGLLETRRRKTSLRIAEPLCRVRDPYPGTIPPSDPKRPQKSLECDAQ